MKPRIRVKPPGPRAKRTIIRDSIIASPSYARDLPLVVEKAYGSNLEDIDGNVYLDFAAGVAVANVGHSNPDVVKAITNQAKKVSHVCFGDFYADAPIRFAERLRDFLPKNLSKVFFTNSGAETIEAALKMARYHTKRKYFLGFYGGFHGRTYGALSVSCSREVHKRRFGPMLPVMHAPYAYCYRCPFGKDHRDCNTECIRYIEDYIFKKEMPAEEFAACVVEPIQGEGGYIVPPRKFHKELKKLCEENGILYVADEIQAGCYRTGKFLASEHFGIKPDIVCLSKAIGAGVPMGVAVASKKIMNWAPRTHSNTFGGNMLASAAALASLDYMDDHHIGEKVEKDGKYALDFLQELQQESKHIGDVRGKGLMIGVELVKDKNTKEPAIKETNEIIKRIFEKGLVMISCGESTLRIAPPLTMTRDDLKTGLELLRNTLLYSKL
jgi:4-aminobutyrate aminotransferase